MPGQTPNLNLYKKNPLTDGEDTFNIETMLNNNWDKLDAAVGGKVDKAAGKGLSTNDYTTEEKSKLDSHIIAVGAGIHGATAVAGPNTIVNRDGAGRTQFGDPIVNADAATKGYVDGIENGLPIKDSVRLATTLNITLSGAQTIDGIVTASGDRVLVKDQATGSQNGIYVVITAGAWLRTADFDSSLDIVNGALVFIKEGAANGSQWWTLINASAPTLGTTALSFGRIKAGDAATVNGRSFDQDVRMTSSPSFTSLVLNRAATNTNALKVTSSSNGWGSGIIFENTASNGKTYGIYSGSEGDFHIGSTTSDSITIKADKSALFSSPIVANSGLTLQNGTIDTPDINFNDTVNKTQVWMDLYNEELRTYASYRNGGTIFPFQFKLATQESWFFWYTSC